MEEQKTNQLAVGTPEEELKECHKKLGIAMSLLFKEPTDANAKRTIEIFGDIESLTFDLLSETLLCQYLLCYFISSNPERARYLWKRTLPAGKDGANVKNVWALGKLLIRKEYPLVFRCIASTTWPEELKLLVEVLSSVHRERMAGLIARAYTFVELAKVQTLLGIDDAKELERFLETRRMRVQGQFVQTPEKEAEEEFALSKERIEAVSAIVQFLEKS